MWRERGRQSSTQSKGVSVTRNRHIIGCEYRVVLLRALAQRSESLWQEGRGAAFRVVKESHTEFEHLSATDETCDELN